MNRLAYEFSDAQRLVLDRYTAYLGSVPQTFNNIPLVFERRRASGHVATVLAGDSRLNSVPFNERCLRDFRGRINEAQRRCRGYVADLTTFISESLEISRRTSRNEPINQVDFKLYSLSRSKTWKLFPPTDLPHLIHELTLRFYELGSEAGQLKYTIAEVHETSFGLGSVCFRAMDHRSCQCHSQPTVIQELFRDARTAPAWDIAYSSADPVVRAAEYKKGVADLFNGLGAVAAQVSVFIEELRLRIDTAIYELLRAERVWKLGELNFHLAAAKEEADESLAMISHLDTWLSE
nr:hypothetical protein [uncultured Pseudomonas sp.]